MSKMHTPEEFENLWVFGLKNSEFSENVHSINHSRIGRSLKNCRLPKNCRVSEMGTEEFTNCWIVESRISEMCTRMWQSLNCALKNSRISKLQSQEYSRISELQTQGCKRISELVDSRIRKLKIGIQRIWGSLKKIADSQELQRIS
jgi:hypothetical protein